MVSAVSIIAVVVTLGFALRSTKALYDGHRHSMLFIIIAHFFLYGLPLILDLCIGLPAYELFDGFYVSSTDPLTTVIYGLLTMGIPGDLVANGGSPAHKMVAIRFGRSGDGILASLFSANSIVGFY